MLNESNIPLEEDGIEEEILVDEEVAITKAMWGDVGGNIENQTDLQNALDAKQDSLTEAQLNAVNSGITAEKVTTYDGYADQIASKADQSALNAESTARGEADTALGTRIDNEVLARQQADNGLQSQIDAITSKSDVVDIVANYAALQAYDTSTLGNNDVVKVLDDETHEDALTYYRWSTTTQTWSYIGQEAPYYSKGQMDVKLAEKQDKLTAGANIQIQNGTISATDTTYTAGNGLNLNGTEFSADTDVLATKEDLEGYYTKPETDNLLAPKLEAEVVAELPTTGAEGKLYLTPKAHTTQTASGNPITVSLDEDEGAIDSFQLDGDTFQQTYTGKNMVGFPATSYEQHDLTLDFDADGTITINGTRSGTAATNYNSSVLFNFSAGDITFTIIPISGSFSGANIGYRAVTGNTQAWYQVVSSSGNYNQETINKTAEQVAQVTSIGFLIGSGMAVFDNFKFKIQVTAGSDHDTDYEPFVGGQPSPNPDYPQQVQTVTGEQTVAVQGKNIINATILRNACSNNDGVSIVSSSKYVRTEEYTPVDADTTYTLSYLVRGSVAMRGNILQYDSNKSFISSIPTAYNATFTTTSTTAFVRLNLYHPDSLVPNDITNLQLELGSTATDYIPFNSTDYPISLGSLELCKLGGYQDYIYKDGDDWKVHNTIRKTIVSGGETWEVALSSLWGSNAYACSSIEGFKPWSPTKSDRFIDAELPQAANIQSGYMQMAGFSWVIRIDSITSVAELKTWLSSNNVTLYYTLATPTDTTITDTNLIAQLEAIRTASLQNGTNTITNTATGSNLAGDMEIGYYGFNPRNRYDKWLWLDLNNNYEQIGS